MQKILFKTLLISALIILNFSVYAQLIEATDTFSFEAPTTKIQILSTTGNLWQIGRPHKTYLDSARTGLNAIITDTINNYPTNDTSSFTLTVRKAYTQTCNSCMEFWTKFDLDTIGDKGIIEASYDYGNTWELLKDTTFNNSAGAFFYWTPQAPQISGNSNGWQYHQFCWTWYTIMRSDTIQFFVDSLYVRFTFISDSISSNKEGWMIDDIDLYTPVCSGGINELQDMHHVKIYPNPFSTKTTITSNKQLKNATLTIYNALGQLVKQQAFSGGAVIFSRDNLPNGLYSLVLTENNTIFANRKIIITD